MRTALAIILAGGAACGTQSGQPEPDSGTAAFVVQQDTILKSASLLRRLAEAADGFRDGQPRFVVAAVEFPHRVLGVFSDSLAADSVSQDSSTGSLHFKAFGPYRTQLEDGVDTLLDNVDSVWVFHRNDPSPTRYQGKDYDALFWGLPAFDKFVAPYLTAVSGATYADSVRELYKTGELTNSELPHKRYSF
jgi:hypothetical protein